MSTARARILSIAAALLLLSAGLLRAPPADAAPGELVAAVTVPVPGAVGVSLAFDGQTFYYTNLGDPTLYGYTIACAGLSCASTLTLAQPIVLGTPGGPSQEIDAMTYDGVRDVLWGAHDSVVFRVDRATGVATPAFSLGACNRLGLVDGLAYDGVDDAFWFSSDGSFEVCKVSVSGVLLAVHSVASLGLPAGCYNSGLAVGGDHLYLGSNGCGRIVRLDKTTFTAADEFASPGGRDEDMECDPITFAPLSVIWSKDAYDNTVTAFEIEPGTCGLGGLSPCADEDAVDVAIARPAAHARYADDAAFPWGQETPLVTGDLTLEGWASDPARVASVTWRVDGVGLGTGGAAPTFAARWPASAAAPGLHVVSAAFHDADGVCVRHAVRSVAVPAYSAEALARAVLVSTSQPVEAILTSPGASGATGPGEHKTLDHREDSVGLRAESLHDEAALREDATGGHSVSVLQRVSLLGGRVQAEVLRAEANVSLDRLAFSTSASAAGSLVAGLVVDGTPIPVTAPNTAVQIPGVGRLVLLETTDTEVDGHRELRVNALHLFLAHDGLRGEVVLGQAIAGADVASVPFVGADQEIDREDDAGTGADAGDSPSTAHPLVPAPAPGAGATVIGGRLSRGDAADHYSFLLSEGQKLEVLVKPAEIVAAGTTTGSIPDNPSFLALQRLDVSTDLDLELRAPDGRLVLASRAPLTLPERIELNADANGTWTVGVIGGGADPTNYTLVLSVTPIHLVDEVPAPSVCGDPAAPVLGRGAGVLDSMRSDDRHRIFRLHADIGDDLTVTLHPLDADGADLDLFLYDRACQLLSWSGLGKSLLWDGDSPKGLPEAVDALPVLATGDYWIEVRRIVGVGNYLLGVQANTVIPTLPGNDAGTGADASDDAAAPTPLAPNSGAFQGRFEEGDARDAYAFSIAAGQRAAITWAASPANRGRVEVQDANGQKVPFLVDTNTEGAFAMVLTEPAPANATWRIVIEPTRGGGNYVLTVAQG